MKNLPSSPGSRSCTFTALQLALLCAGATACATASGPALRASEAVGPDPRAARSAAAEEGTLTVFTELMLNFNEQTPSELYEEVRKPFTILDASRHLVAEVTHAHFHDANIHPVRLQPGSYIVVGPGLAGRTFQQQVEVVVRVDAGRTTEVHFDEPWQPPEGLEGNGLSARALPDWRLGWSARAGARLGTEGELRYVGSPVLARLVADSKAASLSVGGAEADALGALEIGTADLVGLAGEVKAPPGVSCKVIAYDELAVLVRHDSPLRSLDAASVKALETGALSNWSALGQGPAPIVLLVGRGTGARRLVSSPHAITSDPAEVVRRVALAGDAIALTSAASALGEARVRALSLNGEPRAAAVPLSLCSMTLNTKALAIVEWAASAEEQGLLGKRLGLHQVSDLAGR